jgi:SlyX protein
MSIEDRLTELEIRLTHQATTIDELNETVYDQWKTIEILTKDILAIKERFKAIQPSNIDDAPYLPPHY